MKTIQDIKQDFKRGVVDRINEAFKANDYEVVELVGNVTIRVDGQKIVIWKDTYYLYDFTCSITLSGWATEEDKDIHRQINELKMEKDIAKLEADIKAAQDRLEQMKAAAKKPA